METIHGKTYGDQVEGNHNGLRVLPNPGPGGLGGSLHHAISVAAPMLSIDALQKRYANFTLSIEHLQIDTGDVIGLLGPNGAGKTTLIRSLVRITQPDTMQLTWPDHQEKPGTGSPDLHLKMMTGYVPEEPIVYENERVSRLLGFVGALYPNWDDTLASNLLRRFGIDAGKKVSMLSKGMRTKLFLVMALAHRPRILILDEPTSGLDPLSRDDFWGFVRELLSEKHIQAAIISSHQLEDVENICNRAIFLSAGKIVYDQRHFSAAALKQLFELHRPAGRVPCF